MDTVRFSEQSLATYLAMPSRLQTHATEILHVLASTNVGDAEIPLLVEVFADGLHASLRVVVATEAVMVESIETGVNRGR